jgi:hypothetical protein
MRVHESRHQHPPPAIDARGLGVLALELRLRADRDDAVAANGDGDTRHDIRVSHLTSAAGAPWAAARDDLRRIDEQQG